MYLALRRFFVFFDIWIALGCLGINNVKRARCLGSFQGCCAYAHVLAALAAFSHPKVRLL